VNQEHGGIIRRGAKMVYAVNNATVPKISIALRKVYGGAAAAMCGPFGRADLSISWPGVLTAVMGAAGAVNVIYGRELRAIADPAERETKMKEYMELYDSVANDQFQSLRLENTDLMIMPHETRRVIALALRSLRNKKAWETLPKKTGGLMPV